MKKLKILEPVKTFSNWAHLPHDMCSCACGWRGPVSSCDSASDSDGWEHPSYVYHICPVCSLGNDDGEITEYYSSIEAVFEQAFDER